MAGTFGNMMMNAVRPQQQGQQPMQGQQQARPSGMVGAMRQAMPQQQQAPQQRPQMSALMSRMGGAFGQQQSRFGMGQPQGQAPQMQGQMAARMAGMLSDKRSKERIQELEDLTDSYEALMNRDGAAKPELRQPDTEALDRAANYNDVGSYSYKYKDPNAPGAAPGEHVGPMAHELRSIPGVVQQGPDGMDRVDPNRLTMANASAIGEQQREIQDLKETNDALQRRQEMADLDKASKKQSARILSNTPY